MTAYLLQIRRQIERARPLRVDAAGQTRLTFSLAPDGALRDVTIAESSGNPELDRLAVQKLHNAAPFPPAPEGATDEQLLLSIPIRFE
jgi:protein TonB